MALRDSRGWIGIAAGIALLAAGCGGGGSSPTSPSTGGGGGGSVVSGATITIGPGGVSPAQVTVSVGQAVTFVNSGTRTHDMASDPHPAHTDCLPLAPVGNLIPGQTKVSNAFTTARTCGFHDHNNPGEDSLKGSIVIR